MAFCTNCGRELPVNSNHCPNCGAAVRTDDRQAVPKPAVEEMLRPQPLVQEQSYPQPADRSFPPQRQDSGPYRADQFSSQQSNQYAQPLPPVPIGGLVAWAMITLLLCTIPGAIALVKVIGVNNSRTVDEQQSQIRQAKNWCLAGTILGLLYIISRFASA